MDWTTTKANSGDSEPENAAHILVVDDDPEIRDLISRYLSQYGYRISLAADGPALRRMVAVETLDLVILDLGLPGEDGLSLTRHLREHSDTGVIIVTGRGETVDRVVGLEIGADDYVSKPFELRELLARVRSVLRRARAKEASTTPDVSERLRFEGWQMDVVSRQLRSPQGTEVVLTSGEFELLSAFVTHPNRVLSRDELLNLTHHREAGPYDRSVDMQVGRLRRKIESDPEHPAMIKAIRALGYIFTPRVERL